MGILERLEEIAKDVITLEVATLTNADDNVVPLNRTLTPAEEADLKQQKDLLNSARKALVDAIKKPVAADYSEKQKKDAIEAAQDALKDQQKVLNQLEKALGVYDPKDIFSRILAALGTATNVELAAYSRFELEGDSVSYVSNKDSLKEIVAFHKELVAASQASRKALFETVIGRK